MIVVDKTTPHSEDVLSMVADVRTPQEIEDAINAFGGNIPVLEALVSNPFFPSRATKRSLNTVIVKASCIKSVLPLADRDRDLADKIISKTENILRNRNALRSDSKRPRLR